MNNGAAANSVIAYLPASMRPNGNLVFTQPCEGYLATKACRVDVRASDGAVRRSGFDNVLVHAFMRLYISRRSTCPMTIRAMCTCQACASRRPSIVPLLLGITPTPPPHPPTPHLISRSAFGACLPTCGSGTQNRTRTITTPAQFGGTSCPTTLDLQNCTVTPCRTLPPYSLEFAFPHIRSLVTCSDQLHSISMVNLLILLSHMRRWHPIPQSYCHPGRHVRPPPPLAFPLS